MKFTNWIVASASACAILLTACGGGGGGQVGPSGTQEGTSPFAPAPSTTPKAADLDVVADKSQLPNISSGKVIVTATALDAGKRAVPGVDITISIATGSDAVVTQTTKTTDAQGRVSAEITAGAAKGNRTVTINATAGNLSKSINIQVVGASVTSSLSAPSIAPSGNGTVRYRVVDQAANPMANQRVEIVAPGFAPPSVIGTTDINGEYIYAFTAASTQGQFTITATIAGVRRDLIVNVQPTAQAPVVPPETIISSTSISANPSVVAVNPTGSQNRSEIRALVLGANNSPIANMRVRFDLSGDPNGIGGVFTDGSQTITVPTDSNGIATTAYIPGNRPSPTNGVQIKACFGKNDAELANGACPLGKSVQLTVVSDPLGVTIGTDGLIEVNSAKLTYIRKYVVQVVDAAGNPKPDVNLTASVDLPWYYKGEYLQGSDAWISRTRAVCRKEDRNDNGVLDATEDVNQNNRLDPRKSDVQVLLVNLKTGTDGLALLKIEYPQNYGSWVAATVTVTASVGGTEGLASYLENPVPVPVDVVKNKDASPPFQLSPYGLYGKTSLFGGVDGCALTPANESDLRFIDITSNPTAPGPTPGTFISVYPDPALGSAEKTLSERDAATGL